MPAPANLQQQQHQQQPTAPRPSVQQQQQQNHPSQQHTPTQQRPSRDGQPHRSSSSRSVNPATGMPDRVGPYAIREEIGRGSFATVYRGEKVTNNPATPVAIKAVIRSKLTTKLLENLESEIRLLKGIKQRNVVELLDCLKTEAHIYLVMAYCSAGDLSQYIRKRGQLPSLTASMQHAYCERYPHPRDGGLNELVVRCFLGQLAEALKFLRKQNIIHRDIKPQNLLLHPPDASDIAAGHPPGIPLLRVADFGFARALPNASLAETLCGSPLYMAPEILRYEKYDAKADLWSVGAVAYEMSVGKPPFRAQNHVELLRRIERGGDRIKFPDERSPSASADGTPEEMPTRVPDDLKALIRGLLKRNPVERMSFADFFEKAEAVARWGEGSLVAPGTIDGEAIGEAITLRATSASSNAISQKPLSRAPSGRATPALTPNEANAHAGSSPVELQAAAAVEHNVATPAIIPSTDVEQEMAFVRLPQNAYPIPQIGTTVGLASPKDANASTPARAGTPDTTETPGATSRPATLPRRSTFKPKYVVGPTNATQANSSPTEQYGNPALKTRDYAVITTTAATPTTALPVAVSRGHSRRSSQDSLRGQALQPTDILPQQAQPRSNLSLAIPPKSDRQSPQQRDMLASAMTGDDDSVLGREYVVVEKRNVEINALADEMASLPRRQNSVTRRNSRGILSRNPTGYGQSPSSPAPIMNAPGVQMAHSPSPPSPALPYPPVSMQSTAYDHPPFAAPVAARPAPYSYGSSPRLRANTTAVYGSPGRQNATGTYGTQDSTSTAPLSIVGGITTTAIGKALNMASLKLFGSPSENIWLRKQTHRFPFGRRRSRSVTPQDDRLTPEEDDLLQKLDDIGQKATVIFDFADSKLILMQPQSSQQSLASQNPSPSRTENTTPAPAQLALGSSQANPFFVNAAVHAPQPPRASPSLEKQPTSPLANNNQQASSSTASAIQNLGSSSKPDLLPGETLVLYLKALAFLSKGIEQAREFWSTRPAGQTTSPDLNDYVQWLRARFNECFDKAEYAKGRLVGDIPDSAMLAEKLIFDRALEMSRAAAVSELMGDNTQECEIAYDTALWMLYAILDETMQEGEHVEEEDKATVRNFIESIKGRLVALRRKMRGSTAL